MRLVPPGAGFGKINSGALILSGRLTEPPVISVVSSCHRPPAASSKLPNSSTGATVPVARPEVIVTSVLTAAGVANTTLSAVAISRISKNDSEFALPGLAKVIVCVPVPLNTTLCVLVDWNEEAAVAELCVKSPVTSRTPSVKNPSTAIPANVALPSTRKVSSGPPIASRPATPDVLKSPTTTTRCVLREV